MTAYICLNHSTMADQQVAVQLAALADCVVCMVVYSAILPAQSTDSPVLCGAQQPSDHAHHY